MLEKRAAIRKVGGNAKFNLKRLDEIIGPIYVFVADFRAQTLTAPRFRRPFLGLKTRPQYGPKTGRQGGVTMLFPSAGKVRHVLRGASNECEPFNWEPLKRGCVDSRADRKKADFVRKNQEERRFGGRFENYT